MSHNVILRGCCKFRNKYNIERSPIEYINKIFQAFPISFKVDYFSETVGL